MDSKESERKKCLLKIDNVTTAQLKDNARNVQLKTSDLLQPKENKEISESTEKVDKKDEVKNHDLYNLMCNLDVDPLGDSNNPRYSAMVPIIKGDVEEEIRNNIVSAKRNNIFDNELRSNSSGSSNERSTSQNNVNHELALENHQNAKLINVASTLNSKDCFIEYKDYESELQMQDIMRLIQAELSEPYSIYTYRYFIYNWPKLCFLAAHNNEYVGAIVCKLDMHLNVIKRGYIAMLAVKKEYRKMKIGTNLVQRAIEAMLADDADEVVLETEMKNLPALRLYENLGFVRDKRLFRYYLNGVDALRLKLWFR